MRRPIRRPIGAFGIKAVFHDNIRFGFSVNTGSESRLQPIRAVDKVVAQVSNLLYRRASSLHAVRAISRARRFGRSADWKSAIQQVGNLMPLTFGMQDRGVQSRRDCINQPRVARNELPWGHEITTPSTLKGLQRLVLAFRGSINWRMPIHRQQLIQPLQG